MDFARRPYRTRVRPFFDSETEVTFQWYRAPENAPAIGPAAIMSLDWLANGYDDRQAIMEVGEVPGTSRNYHAFRTPIGLDFHHVCGTPEEFTDGAAFDPLADVKYDEQGLPLCCGGPALPEFELELEFDAVSDFVGHNCEDAELTAVDTDVQAVAANAIEDWYRFETNNFSLASFVILAPTPDDATLYWELWRGFDCASKILVDTFTGNTGTPYAFLFPSLPLQRLWVRVSQTSGAPMAYKFRVDEIL